MKIIGIGPGVYIRGGGVPVLKHLWFRKIDLVRHTDFFQSFTIILHPLQEGISDSSPSLQTRVKIYHKQSRLEKYLNVDTTAMHEKCMIRLFKGTPVNDDVCTDCCHLL